MIRVEVDEVEQRRPSALLFEPVVIRAESVKHHDIPNRTEPFLGAGQ